MADRVNIHCRDETAADAETIRDILQNAFANHPHSVQNEHEIVARLRQAQALELSLVAEHAHACVGYVVFSRVTIINGSMDWYGLGPLAVMREFHGRGIGSQLVREGLARLRARSAYGCVVLGSPQFYGRHGFLRNTRIWLAGAPPEKFQSLSFTGDYPSGEVMYHEAFGTIGSCDRPKRE